MLFRDRRHAGRVLAQYLSHYAQRPGVVVLGLPRGGVPVAYEVARQLGAPLDVFLVRKLGLPGQPELAMGAIASGGVRVLNEDVVGPLGIGEDEIDAVVAVEQTELERRERVFRGDRPPLDLTGKIVILIDDGLATGSTMRAAARSVRRRGPARIVVAVPVAARTTCEELASEVDEVVCPNMPAPFYAVGLYYGDFSQTSDEEVRDLLEEANRSSGQHQTIDG
jgi:putative phosphoribosyl transferase